LAERVGFSTNSAVRTESRPRPLAPAVTLDLEIRPSAGSEFALRGRLLLALQSKGLRRSPERKQIGDQVAESPR
jgi:hypothetical protein